MTDTQASTQTCYQIQLEECEYTHGMVYGQYITLEECLTEYNKLIELCISEGDKNTTDYVCIEEIESVVDDGYVDEVIDIGDIIKEHVFNEPPA